MEAHEIRENLDRFGKLLVANFTGPDLFPPEIAKDIEMDVHQSTDQDVYTVTIWWFDLYNQARGARGGRYYFYARFHITGFAMQDILWRESVLEKFKECICEFSLWLEQEFT